MQKKNNIEIRKAIKAKNLYYYEVAESLGISDFTFSRMLRKELTDNRKAEILNAISGMKAETR